MLLVEKKQIPSPQCWKKYFPDQIINPEKKWIFGLLGKIKYHFLRFFGAAAPLWGFRVGCSPTSKIFKKCSKSRQKRCFYGGYVQKNATAEHMMRRIIIFHNSKESLNFCSRIMRIMKKDPFLMTIFTPLSDVCPLIPFRSKEI